MLLLQQMNLCICVSDVNLSGCIDVRWLCVTDGSRATTRYLQGDELELTLFVMHIFCPIPNMCIRNDKIVATVLKRQTFSLVLTFHICVCG